MSSSEPAARWSSARTISSPPSSARRPERAPKSSPSPISSARLSAIGPESRPAVTLMMATPVSRSPAMIARSIGAAPRQRGSREGWTFSISSSDSSGSLMSCPKAQTTPTSGRVAWIASTASGRLTLSVCSSSSPSSDAASAAGGAAIWRPRPRGRSGGVTTSAGRWGESARRRSTATANSEVPRYATLNSSRRAPGPRPPAPPRSGCRSHPRAAPAGPPCADRARSGRA